MVRQVVRWIEEGLGLGLGLRLNRHSDRRSVPEFMGLDAIKLEY